MRIFRLNSVQLGRYIVEIFKSVIIIFIYEHILLIARLVEGFFIVAIYLNMHL